MDFDEQLNQRRLASYIKQLREHMNANGILSPAEIIPDRNFHHFKVPGGPDCCYAMDPETGNTFYTSFRDLGTKGIIFTPKRDEPLSSEEKIKQEEVISALKKKYLDEKKQEHEKAALECKQIWDDSEEGSDEHPYLVQKKVGCYGLRQTNGVPWNKKIVGDEKCLIMPLCDKDGNITTLQCILPYKVNFAGSETNKIMYKGGAKTGSYFRIGSGDPLYLVEGYATGASVYEAMQFDGVEGSVIVAGDCGNLEKVAGYFPTLRAIVADNDENGAGVKGANKAKDICPFAEVMEIPEKGMDANDYANAFGLVTLSEFIKLKDPSYWLKTRAERYKNQKPQEYFIHDWVVKGNSFNQIFGKTGNGKSFVVVDLIQAIVHSKIIDWHGYHIDNHGKVLYLCGEGQGSIDDRMTVWEQVNDLPPSENIMISDGACDLDTPEGLQKIIAILQIRSFEPDVIFVDTLNRFMSGDENNATEMRAFMNNCQILQQKYDAAVYMITHTGKDPNKQDFARGSSALDAACDNIIKCSKEDLVITLAFTKVKRGKSPAPMGLLLRDYIINDVLDQNGKPITCAVCQTYDTSSAPGRSYLSSKDEQRLRLFASALIAKGEEIDSRMYITKENLRNYLKNEGIFTSSSLTQQLSLTSKDSENRFLGSLVLKLKAVKETKNGLTLADGVVVPGFATITRGDPTEDFAPECDDDIVEMSSKNILEENCKETEDHQDYKTHQD